MAGDDDRTVLIPTPGGRSRLRPGPAAAPSVPASDAGVREHTGVNPLVGAASVLLSLVGQLRNTTSHPDVQGLRARVVEEVQQFEKEARAQNVGADSVLAASYALCTLVDETVLGTPWGSESFWSGQSLLSAFHKEGWGGERFFLILDRLMQEPARNLELLELMSICLSLGFKGKYGVRATGKDELEELQERVYGVIRAQRGEFERELSPHWRGVEDRRNPLIRYVPLWVVAAVVAAALLGTYLGFRVSLNRHAYPEFAQLSRIGGPSAPRVEKAATAPAPTSSPVHLEDLLRDPLEKGLIDLRQDGDFVTIVIRGDGLFASGSAEVAPAYIPLLDKIADALRQTPGQIQVTGHTDDVPIRSLRFPNNWALSRARAQNVEKMIAKDLGSERRLRAEGRADTEPLVPNNTNANRALNRRVEITLLPRSGMR